MTKKHKQGQKQVKVAIQKDVSQKQKVDTHLGKHKKTVKQQSADNNLWFMLLTVVLVAAAVMINLLWREELALLYRVLIMLVLIVLGFVSFLQTNLGKNTISLARGTQFELRKVVWPTRNETLQSAGMVFVFVLIVSLFLWLIDTLFTAFFNLFLG